METSTIPNTLEFAKTLHSLEQDVKDAIDEHIKDYGLLDEPYPEDTVDEIVDGQIPVYTADILRVALSNFGLACEVPEIYAFSGEHNAVNAIAGNLYEHLHSIAHEYFGAQRDNASA